MGMNTRSDSGNFQQVLSAVREGIAGVERAKSLVTGAGTDFQTGIKGDSGNPLQGSINAWLQECANLQQRMSMFLDAAQQGDVAFNANEQENASLGRW